MVLSPFGIIVLLLTPVILALNINKLLHVFVVSIPFYTVQVADLGYFTLKVFQYLALLVGIKGLFLWLRKNQSLIYVNTSHIAGISVAIVFCFSLVMPLVHHGEIQVFGHTGAWRQMAYNPTPLRLSVHNFTQLIYFIFGLYIFYIVSTYNDSKYKIFRTAKLYVFSVNLIGLNVFIYSIMSSLGYKYIMDGFYSLFWAKKIPTALPVHTQFGDLLRGFTLAGEPGFTGIILTSALSLLVGSAFFEQNVFKYTKLNIFYLLICVAMNGSTTAYLGVLLLLLFSYFLFFVLSHRKKLSFSNFLTFNLLLFVLLAMLSTITVSKLGFMSYLEAHHLSKFFSYNSPRFVAAYHNFYNVFLESPILGAGYGSSLSLSLSTFLLANVGLLGVGVFLLFIGFVLYRCYCVISARKLALSSLSGGVVLAALTYFSTISVAKAASSLIFASPWFILGLADAISRARNDSKKYFSSC